MEALLVHHPDAGLHLQLAETPLSQTTPLSIGRQAGAHLLIDEASVSRRHAVISYINKQYMVQELGSTNGTFVNNERVELARPYIIRPNDILRIGNIVTFKFLLRSSNLKNQTSRASHRSSALQPDEISIPMKQIAQDQPVLNHDGTLSSPGIEQPVPASVVATFKEVPALIILPASSGGANSTPPWVYLLKPSRLITIGRERGNVIELGDPIVSRRHAELFLAASGCYIRDLGSSNGIIINRVRIARPSQLSHGDRIKLGETILFFIDLQAGHEQTEKNPAPALSVDYNDQKILSLYNRVVHTPPAPHSALVANTSYIAATHNRVVQTPLEMHSVSKAISHLAEIYNGTAHNSLTRRIPAIKASERKGGGVICSRCGVANTQVSRFCASCSTMLNV
jgi:pSer/pThr/pTyr-binding forkhead associated (FHA) protein